MPTVITNRDLTDSVLPAPFSVALGPLGSVIYEGTPAEVFQRAPSIQGRFTVKEITASDSLPMPGFRDLSLPGRAAVAIVGINIVGANEDVESWALPAITPALLGQRVVIQRYDADSSDYAFTSSDGFQTAGGVTPSGDYTFQDTVSLVEFTAIQIAADAYAWLLTSSIAVD